MFFNDSFLQMAFFASLLASFASGTMGAFVVVKRIVFIAGSISHSILAGTSFCLWLQKTQNISWITPTYGAFAAAVGSALLLGWIHLKYRQREDAIIAAIWSTGMAIGIIFLSVTPGNNVEMMNFLFGNILWITSKDLLLLGSLDLLIILAVVFNYKKFLALCFDEEQALLRGIPVKKLYLLLLSIIAITIVLLVQIIGTILVIALLTIPATFASLFTRNLPAMMMVATLLSALFSFGGLATSYFLNWPAGATIALFSAACYLIALFAKKKRFALLKK
ncbi:MAG TPA: metal ABC transporter permease [Chlamydiales bacterium]|nr:metal ABC transporter permease [Chlamydiales bacterium]